MVFVISLEREIVLYCPEILKSTMVQFTQQSIEFHRMLAIE